MMTTFSSIILGTFSSKRIVFLMQNGDFGRLGPRLDLPGKKIGGGPKAQGVSKSGEFNTLSMDR